MRFLQHALVAATLAAAPFAGAMAQGDPAAGQRVFNQCMACHTINEGGRNGVGPNLRGVYGSKAAQKEGFRYSANLRELAEGGLTWDQASLERYLRNPKDLVPRGSMAFAGIRNDEQLANVIAFLRQNSQQ